MNIKSASGFPTPKTVCVREQARCAHFVQAHTRSRIGSSNAALFGARGCPLGTSSFAKAPADESDSTASAAVACAVLSAKLRATAEAVRNRASTVFDALGKRSFVSRIF